MLMRYGPDYHYKRSSTPATPSSSSATPTCAPGGPQQTDSGRCRARTSELLLVRDAQEGEGRTRAVTADADFACKREAFVEWLAAGSDGVWTADVSVLCSLSP